MQSLTFLRKIKIPFLLKLIENIEQKRIVVMSLVILQYILSSFDSKEEVHSSCVTMTLKLNQEHNLLEVLINSLVTFANEAAARTRDEKIADPNNFCFRDQYTYYVQVFYSTEGILKQLKSIY